MAPSPGRRGSATIIARIAKAVRHFWRDHVTERTARHATLEELWAGIDAMAKRLEGIGLPEAAAELRHGYSCLNGLTDGWADFRDSVEKVSSDVSDDLDREDRRRLAMIRASARYAMRRR